MNSVNVFFSDFFNIDEDVIESYGAINISLINDLPLFIDPFLLFNSTDSEYQKIHHEMIDYLLFLQRQFRNLDEKIKAVIYIVMGFAAIPLSKAFPLTPLFLIVIRTMFSLFFVYLGHIYTTKIHGKYDIFTPKILGAVICLQAVLWHFNRDFDPVHGIGLSYVLVWARFDSQIVVPVLTSITGIWFSLFFINVTYDYLKNIKFIKLVGENTYHIMANHLFVMYLITALIFKINGIPISERNLHNIYWIYNPVQNTYLYFVLTMVITTFTGAGLKLIKSKIPVIKDL